MTFAERVEAIRAFGYAPREAAFLTTVRQTASNTSSAYSASIVSGFPAVISSVGRRSESILTILTGTNRQCHWCFSPRLDRHQWMAEGDDVVGGALEADQRSLNRVDLRFETYWLKHSYAHCGTRSD